MGLLNAMRSVSMCAGAFRRRLIGATATIPLVLAACGDPAERALCPSYEQFLESREVIRAVDPESESAADAIDEIETFRSSVRQLRENTDGRFRSAVDDLDASISNVLRTLATVDADADYATWAPLVADDVETAQEAAARVDELIAPQCTPTDGS